MQVSCIDVCAPAADFFGKLQQPAGLRPPFPMLGAVGAFQHPLQAGIKEIFLQQHSQVGTQRGQELGNEHPIGEEVADIQAVPAEQLLLEQRQEPVHGLVVFAQGKQLKILTEMNMRSAVYATAVPAHGTLFLNNRSQLFAIAAK